MSMIAARRLVTRLGAILLSAAGAAAQKTVTRQQVVGDWEGQLVLDNGAPSIRLSFKITDTTLTGAASFDGSTMGRMEHLMLSGNRIHFKVDVLDWSCVVDGSVMNVALIVYNGTTRHVTLLKKPAAPPPDGQARSRQGGGPTPP